MTVPVQTVVQSDTQAADRVFNRDTVTVDKVTGRGPMRASRNTHRLTLVRVDAHAPGITPRRNKIQATLEVDGIRGSTNKGNIIGEHKHFNRRMSTQVKNVVNKN